MILTEGTACVKAQRQERACSRDGKKYIMTKVRVGGW